MAYTILNADRSSRTFKKAPPDREAGLAHSKSRWVCCRVWLAALAVSAGIGLAPVLYAQLRGTTTPGLPENLPADPRSIAAIASSVQRVQTRETPLHDAASRGQASEVRRLIESGADVNAKSASGATPLQVAAANGHLEAVEALLRAGASVNEPLESSGETALLLAIRNGHSDVALRLLKAGAHPSAADQDGVSGLHLAIEQEQFRVATELIERGAAVNAKISDGRTPLSLAVVHKQVPIATALLQAGADPNIEDGAGVTPLHLAALEGHAQLVSVLLAYGANVNATEKQNAASPLHFAAGSPGQLAVVRWLSDHGANVNQPTAAGITPLHLAAWLGDLEVAGFLLGRGANLNARGQDGYSALVLAVARGHARVADYLIQQGIDVNAQGTADHVTALFLAAHNGQDALVKLLIQHGADINARHADGSTPLMASLGRRHIAVAEQLINAGAREDFERDPMTAVLVDLVKARSSGNQRRYEQVVLRGGFFSASLAGMYVDEALARRARGEDEGGFLEIAEGVAKIQAEALGTDEFARVLQGYARMTKDECEQRLNKTAMLEEARGAFEEGKLDEAERLGEQALETFDKSDDQLSRLKAFIHLAETSYKAGRLEQADLYERKIDLLLSQWGYERMDKARVILGSPLPKEAEEDAGLSDAQRFGYVVADLDSLPDASVAGMTEEQDSDRSRRPSAQTPQAVRMEKANALARGGKDADALREYQALLADTVQGVTNAQRAQALLGAARAARRLHQFGHANFYYEQAHQQLLRVGDAQAALTAQLGLADLLAEIGRWREAVDYYNRALKTAKASKSDASSAMILFRVGNLFAFDGDQIRAIEYYEEALSQLRKPGSLEEALLLMNIGTVYARAGKAPEALHYYEYVLNAWKELNPSLETKVRVNMALVHHGAGNNSEGWKQIEALTSLDYAKADPELSWRAERAGALIQQAMTHPDLAANEYANAIRQLEDIDARSGDLEQAAKTHILEQRRFVYREYLDLLVDMARNHPGQGYEARVLELSEKVKSRIFTDMVARSNAARATPGLANRLDADRDRELQISRLRQQLDAALQQPRGDRDEKKIESLRAQVQLAEQTREADWARLGQARWANLISSFRRIRPAAEMQNFLTNEEVVISYAVGIRSVIALVVTKDRLLLLPLPTNPAELEGLITRFRSGLDDVADWQDLERFDPVIAHQLYEKILKPLTGYLAKGSRVIVCGDELLYSVPLEALVDEPLTTKDFALAREKARSGVGDYLSEYAGPHYVIDSYAISYLPSLSVLALMRERQAGQARKWRRPLIAFGDPVFTSESGEGKPPNATKDLAGETGIQIQRGDAMVFKSHPEKPVSIADYDSLEDLLGALLNNSTLSLKRGDKVLVDDIKGKELFGGLAFTPDVEGQFFKKALVTATGGQTLQRLRDTNEEVRLVAEKTGATEADLFLRDRATKANLYSTDLKGTRYLLFATHGFLGGDFSGIAEPALALSQTGDPQGYDGFLTMSEVSALDLDSELVVLSACNTAGQGHKAVSGDGFAGLTRSFMAAGADSLLVSHWSVDSQAARDVVSTFFDLKNTLPTTEALREAKQSIKRRTRQIGKKADGFKMSQSHPFFWAPFIFVGVEQAQLKPREITGVK